MKTLNMFKKRLPLILALFCLLVTTAISGTAKIRQIARTAAVQTEPKKIIVIDAGHGGLVINLVER